LRQRQLAEAKMNLEKKRNLHWRTKVPTKEKKIVAATKGLFFSEVK